MADAVSISRMWNRKCAVPPQVVELMLLRDRLSDVAGVLIFSRRNSFIGVYESD